MVAYCGAKFAVKGITQVGGELFGVPLRCADIRLKRLNMANMG